MLEGSHVPNSVGFIPKDSTDNSAKCGDEEVVAVKLGC